MVVVTHSPLTILRYWLGLGSNRGFKVGITSLGDTDTIAPAVKKGNKTLLDWINKEIDTLAGEQFFHKDYERNLAASLW